MKKKNLFMFGIIFIAIFYNFIAVDHVVNFCYIILGESVLVEISWKLK